MSHPRETGFTGDMHKVDGGGSFQDRTGSIPARRSVVDFTEAPPRPCPPPVNADQDVRGIPFVAGSKGEAGTTQNPLFYDIGSTKVEVFGPGEGHTFRATVHNGTVDMFVRNRNDSGGRHPHMHPSELVGSALAHFEANGDPVERIRDSWTETIAGVPNDNYASYRNALSASEKTEFDDDDRKAAAVATWTGKVATRNGFMIDRVDEIDSSIEVIFVKAEESEEPESHETGWQSGYHKSSDMDQLWERRDAIGEDLRGSDKTREEIAAERGISVASLKKDIAALEEQAVREILAGIDLSDTSIDIDSDLGKSIAERLKAARQPYIDERARLLSLERAQPYENKRIARASRYRVERDPEQTGLQKAWERLCEGQPIMQLKRTRPIQ